MQPKATGDYPAAQGARVGQHSGPTGTTHRQGNPYKVYSSLLRNGLLFRIQLVRPFVHVQHSLGQLGPITSIFIFNRRSVFEISELSSYSFVCLTHRDNIYRVGILCAVL